MTWRQRWSQHDSAEHINYSIWPFCTTLENENNMGNRLQTGEPVGLTKKINKSMLLLQYFRSFKKTKGKRGRLTASILVAVVATVVVPVTLPLRWDAGTLAKRADRTREVVPPTRALCAALNTCTHTHTPHRKKGWKSVNVRCFILGGILASCCQCFRRP